MKVPEHFKTQFFEAMQPVTIALLMIFLFSLTGLFFFAPETKLICMGMLLAETIIVVTAFSERKKGEQ